MTPEQEANVGKWVAALRSGEYRQTMGGLQRDGRFCCLGVACFLFDKANPGVLEVSEQGGWTAYDGASADLPERVQTWLGVAHSFGQFQKDDESFDYVSGWNDDGRSFSEIADLIESRPPGLFA